MLSSAGSIQLWVSTLIPKEANHSSDLPVSTTEARRSAPASWHLMPGQYQWGESSLEDVTSNISPIAASSGSRSISPPVDLVELWTNANKALDELLSTKGSIDARRQKAVWELGVMLCQNESPAAAMIKEARVISSQTTLDIWTACSQSLLEAKTSY